MTRGVLVALHGWGANGQDLASLAAYLDLPDYLFVFPDATFPHPYAPAGRMWYGLPLGYTFQTQPDLAQQPDLITSRQALTQWLLQLPATTGVPLSQTVLAGFSQGGAMTLEVGTSLPLAALMVLSGYLHAPLPSDLSSIPPVLMVHGRQDAVVPLVAAHQARDSLLKLGATVEYYEYEMGHEIQPIVLQIMQSFLRDKGFPLGAAVEST